MPEPWILKELYAAQLLQPNWTVSWIAVRHRNYLCELAQGKRRIIAKFLLPGARNSANAGYLANEYKLLKDLTASNQREELRELVPTPAGSLQERGIWLQQFLPGRPLRSSQFMSQESIRQGILTRLDNLHRFTRTAALKQTDLIKELKQRSPESPHVSQALEAAEWLCGKLAACTTHNDLNPSNVMLDDQNRLTFVDWTFNSRKGIPCFDWFDLVAYSARESGSTWSQLMLELQQTQSSLTQMFLSGADSLLGDRDVSIALLRLFVATRLANLAHRDEPLLCTQNL